METKKSPNADLENKRFSFILIGLVVVVALCYIALQWSREDIPVYDGGFAIITDEGEEFDPIVIITTPPPPKTEVALPPPVSSEFETVGNDKPDVGDNRLGSEPETNPTPPPPAPPLTTTERPIEIIDDPIFNPEHPPVFPGGAKAMQKYLSKEVKYPTVSAENKIEGRVVLLFVVDKDGKVVNVEVIKGVDKYIDAEAVRLMEKMPLWQPGVQGGKTVKVKMTMPIDFTL